MNGVQSLNNSVFKGSISEKFEGPDLSYSLKTIAAIVGTVALAVIGIIGIALFMHMTAPICIFFGLPMAIMGLTGIVAVPILAYEDRTHDIAVRTFNYADQLEDEDQKILWMGKAADMHVNDAIEKEFNIGKKIMLDSFLESKETKMQKYQKGLNILHSALNHSYSINGFASKCLKLQSSLSDQLKKYHAQVVVGEKTIDEFEAYIIKYAKKLLKYADTRVQYEDTGKFYQHKAIWRPC